MKTKSKFNSVDFARQLVKESRENPELFDIFSGPLKHPELVDAIAEDYAFPWGVGELLEDLEDDE